MPVAPALVEARSGDRVGAARELLRGGRVAEAVVELRALRDAAGSTAVDALLLECHLAQGELTAARALGTALAAADPSGRDPHALHARGELAAALGDPDAAVERFRAAGAAGGDRLGLAWRAGSAWALLRLGQRAEAHEAAVDHLRAAVADGTPYDVALALRVLATCDASAEAPARRVPRLREALELLAGVEADRLQAQVETDLAGLLLLHGERTEALALLRAAEDRAGRRGLWPLQGRVRRLLDVMGEEPRRAESETLAVLTAAERRVALLAVEGLTNRQVAERLAVSVKAVEGHLSKVYRKLGLRSRAALVAALVRG